MFIEAHNGRPGYENQIVRINIQYITDYGNLVTVPEKYKNFKGQFLAESWMNLYPNGQYYLQETVEQIDKMINSLMSQYAE